MKKLLVPGIIVLVIAGIVAAAFALHNNPSKPTLPATQSSANNSAAKDQNKPSINNAVLTTKTDPALGKYLADPSGRPLYTYDADASGKSNCSGACLSDWPPYEATGVTTGLPADVGTIKRADNGKTQYTYMGMPLYYFTGDNQGKVTGDGVEGFSIAKPMAMDSQSAPSTQAPVPSQNDTAPAYSY